MRQIFAFLRKKQNESKSFFVVINIMPQMLSIELNLNQT